MEAVGAARSLVSSMALLSRQGHCIDAINTSVAQLDQMTQQNVSLRLNAA
jgi:predicted RNA-binding protein YlqC (UPF0109 family)